MPQLTRHLAHWPTGVPHTLAVPDRNLFDHLAQYAISQPCKPAIEYYGRLINYQELYQGATRLAGYLQKRLNIHRGDRVLLLMQNCPQFAIAYYAILRCDAVVVALSPMSATDEIEHYATDCGATVLIATQDLLPAALPLLSNGILASCVVGAYSEYAGDAEHVPYIRIPQVVSAPFSVSPQRGLHAFPGALAAGLTPSSSSAKGSDLAVIAYTSGTTGKPKGAMLSHRALVHSVEQRMLWLGLSDVPTSLAALPANHLAGMGQMNTALASGRCMIWLTRWDAVAALELIERRSVEIVGGVATMMAEMVELLKASPWRDMSSVRGVMAGGTHIPESLANAIEHYFHVPLLESYGMTETCGPTHLNPPHATRRHCAGIPQINVDSRVLDLETGAELGPNQEGELVSNTVTLFLGYWNLPQDTRAAMIEIDGKPFVRTGDIGYYDDEGYFYITDRLKRMINASGLKVWPGEIEYVLHEHPLVQDACVISARDTRRGETVKALVVLQPVLGSNLTPAELEQWCRASMAAYKVPRMIEFVNALPKSSTGKIQWKVLQAHQDRLDRMMSPE